MISPTSATPRPDNTTIHGRYAVLHECNDGGCVALVDQKQGQIGCFSAAPLKKLTPGNICFQSFQASSGDCTFPACSETRMHAHAFSSGPILKAGLFKQAILYRCTACDKKDPPSSCPLGGSGFPLLATASTRARSMGEAGSKDTKGSSLPTKEDVIDVDVTDLELDAQTVRTVIVVGGICCPSEVPVVERTLQRLSGVESVTVNVTAKTATVQHIPSLVSPPDLVNALNKASLNASLKNEPTTPGWNCRVPILFACGFFWALSAVSIADHEGSSWIHNLKFVALGTILLGLPRIAFKAYGALRNSILDINCLMSLATFGAIAIGDYVEGAAVVFLFGLSEWLEDKATAKARNALKSLLDLKPEEATLAETNQKIPVESVQVGDVLSLRAGEKVPVDAVVVKGTSSLDESALTGESVPVVKREGAELSAGTINVGGGYLEMRAVAAASDSTVARMVKLIEEANASRSKTEKRVEAFAKVYTPTVVVLASLMAVVPWFFMDQHTALDWVKMALVLLVVACPCALVISTPITYVSALSCAAKHQILIRGGEFLEELGHLSTVGFDKTGTLTEGRFGVREVLAPFNQSNSLQIQQILALAAAVERKSTHPIATAIVAHAETEGADMALTAEDVSERAGEGVEANVNGTSVQVGSRRLAERMGWLVSDNLVQKTQNNPLGNMPSCVPSARFFGFSRLGGKPCGGNLPADLQSQIERLENAGQTVCYVGVAGELAAVLAVADAPRPESKGVVAKLEALGVLSVMLTGDRRATAEAVAAALGVKTIRAELLPEGKVVAMTELKRNEGDDDSWASWLRCQSKRGGVAMVGDGINDAAALAASNVGIAMGAAGTQVAMESAHVVLMDSDLEKLVFSIRLGRLTLSKIKQNIIFAMVSKFAMVAITMAGYATLWLAILADLGAMLIVTLNSSAILRKKKV